MYLAEFESALKKDDLDQIDRNHSWHPFTQMQEYLGFPQIHIESGEGCWLFDTEGNKYLDTNASIWTNVHGHNDPDLNQALQEQLHKHAHSTWLGLSHPSACRLTEKLISITPENLQRIVYSDNGSNAVEIALKLSFQYWQLTGNDKKKIAVGMTGAYHGDSIGTMSVGNSSAFHSRFDHWCFESRTFPAPRHHEYNGEVYESSDTASLNALEKLFENESEEIACLVIEPSIQGAAGMQLQSNGFLKKVSELCKKYNVHLILDEVFVAFGRTGSMFVCSEENVEPDFLCLAKGISGGYLPLAATLTSDKIFEAFLGDFESKRAFFHGHTFSANPLASAVSFRNIEKLETLIGSGKLSHTIDYFGYVLEKTFSNHPNVSEIRQRGLTAAIDLKPSDGSNEFPVNDRVGMQVCIEARKHNLLLRPVGDTLLIVPPLVISNDEIDFLFKNTLTAINSTIK